MIDPCAPAPADEVFLFASRRLLLVLHGAGSIVLTGAATHHLLSMRHYLRGHFTRAKQEKTWARVVALSYAVTFALGALLYPSYRVHVRGYYLDRYAPGYAGLFDVKEVYASLALVVALGLGLLSYAFDPARDKALVRVYAAMSAIVCAVVWLDVIAGMLVLSVRGLG
ncbi:MAG: hypothetical protein ABI193_21990 [Minicystis sp.]